MKRVITLLMLVFQSVLFAQKKEYNYSTVGGIIEHQKENPNEKFPEGTDKKIIQLLTQYEKSESYIKASLIDKLFVKAALSKSFLSIADLKASNKYVKEYIDLYETEYEYTNKKNNSINYIYRTVLLIYADYLSRNSSNLNEILRCLEKAKKTKIDLEEVDSYLYIILWYEGMAYGNAKYYDKAIKSIQNATYYFKKYQQNKNSHYFLAAYYQFINYYTLEKIINTNLPKSEVALLLKSIDQNILEIEQINSNETNWIIVYSQKAYADYFRNNFTSAKIFLKKALSMPVKEGFFESSDYLNPKIIKLLILVKTKNYKPINALRKEIESDIFFKEAVNRNDLQSILKQYYTALIEYEKNQKNYNEALELTEKRQLLIDNDREERLNLKLKEFQEKYNISQKNLEIAKLNNNKKKLIIGSIVLGILLLLVAFFSYYYLRKKHVESIKLTSKIKDITENEINKINFASQEAIKELKKQFSMQLHTDVGSVLVAANNFLKVKKKLEVKIENQPLWDAMTDELEKIYKIIRHESHEIYKNSYSNKQFLVELEKNIQLIFSTNDDFNLHTYFDIQDKTEINIETKLSILTTIKEGCTNVVKYAKAKNIDINLIEDDCFVVLEIKDDGKQKFVNTNFGIGLKTLKEKILNLEGNLYYGKRKNCDGFEIIASFPK